MNYSAYNDTIVAQCTPSGSGAIALLRLSGEQALSIADIISCLPQDKRISTASSHTIQYGTVIDPNRNDIDQVLFLVMHGPHTFTGENTVEITCHNNPFIINAIIHAAIAAGARIAQQGEFTRRAVMHNKIGLTQAEAINDLIHANTQQALKQSLSQLQGSFSHWITQLEKQLIKALALSEASFEFLDEENMSFELHIKEIIETVLSHISSLQKTFNQQQQIKDGIRIAIIGSVNAGKSSFFNALLHQNRAIVSNIAGTTRDVIEAGLYTNDNYWTLIDTAGLRSTDDTIEQLGIERSYEQAHKADIILLVFDSSRSFTSAETEVYNDLANRYQNKTIIIKNKVDLQPINTFMHSSCPTIEFSSITKDTITLVEQEIQKKIETLLGSIESPFLLNQRHYNALLSLEQHLVVILTLLTGNISYELVSYHFKDALAILSELTGKTISEAGMDAVFREFCVGK